MDWALLVLSLPTDNTAARMRAWRALKAAGAAVLRDGAYLLPDTAAQRAALQAVADDVRANAGQAELLHAARCDHDLTPRFDRSGDYGEWLAEATRARALADAGHPAEAQRAARRLRRALDQLVAIDFFAGEAQRQAAAAMAALDGAVLRAASPDEPHADRARAVPRADRARFRRRLWATRARPWVDRLACGWLIRRHIDPEARFVWLASPDACPKRAVGFDFDGATFSHVGARVTFETLLAAFELETPALRRIGAIVHALDVGGVHPPEAAGVERVLAGMRDAIADDDRLLDAAAAVFEGLHIAFQAEGNA